MKLTTRFKKLTLWNKLGAIGAICSMLGLLGWLVWPKGTGEIQKAVNSPAAVIQKMQDSPGAVQVGRMNVEQINLQRPETQTNPSGEITPEKPAEPSEYLTLLIGDGSFKISTSDYRRGKAIKPLMFFCGSDYEITFRKGQDRVLVSAEVTSVDGRVVAEIKDNKWIVNRNNYFKKTSTERGLEVVDNYNLPILQVEVVDESTIAMCGVFVSKDMTIVATKKGISVMGGQRSLDQIRKELKTLPRLFIDTTAPEDQ